MAYGSQDYKKVTVRTSAVTTNSYVAGTVIENTHLLNQLIVLLDFTKGSLTSAELKIEFSPDNNAFYQETFSTISSGTSTDSLGEHTFTATGKYRIPVPIKDRYIKISVKGTGTVTNSLAAVDALIGVA